jgi:putative phage-type endonuclease
VTTFDNDRAAGIGGSDVPAILGISPWATPLDVWLEKVHHPSWRPKAVTPEMRFGSMLEPVLRAAYSEDTGRQVFAPGGKTYFAKDGIRFAHLDGIVEGEGIWEGKAPFQTYRQWVDGPPAYVHAQVQHYLAISGEPWCDVSALAAGLDPIFQTHRIPADPETQANIESAVMRFWREHVEPVVPPAELPAILEWPRHKSDLMLVADDTAERMAAELLSWKEDAAAGEVDADAIKEELKRLIGGAAGMVGQGWRIRYKATKDRTATDWKLVAESFRRQLEEVERVINEHAVTDAEAAVEAALGVLTTAPPAAIISLYTTLTPGTRPFVLERQEDK